MRLTTYQWLTDTDKNTHTHTTWIHICWMFVISSANN